MCFNNLQTPHSHFRGRLGICKQFCNALKQFICVHHQLRGPGI